MEVNRKGEIEILKVNGRLSVDDEMGGILTVEKRIYSPPVESRGSATESAKSSSCIRCSIWRRK